MSLQSGEAFEVVLANVWSTHSSRVAVRIFDGSGDQVAGIGYDKDIPNPVELAGDSSAILRIQAGVDGIVPGEFTAVAELFQQSGGTHAPLLSAQVIARDELVGIWGTGGVALNAIWGTGGVARTGIWGTGGVARTGIWGTGGVAWDDVVGAFPAVHVGANETYRLAVQNPYDDTIEVDLHVVDLDGKTVASESGVVLGMGQSFVLEQAAGSTALGSVVGLVHLAANSGSEAGPLATMQLLRADGRAGIWGTGGVAYEVDAN